MKARKDVVELLVSPAIQGKFMAANQQPSPLSFRELRLLHHFPWQTPELPCEIGQRPDIRKMISTGSASESRNQGMRLPVGSASCASMLAPTVGTGSASVGDALGGEGMTYVSSAYVAAAMFSNLWMLWSFKLLETKGDFTYWPLWFETRHQQSAFLTWQVIPFRHLDFPWSSMSDLSHSNPYSNIRIITWYLVSDLNHPPWSS